MIYMAKTLETRHSSQSRLKEKVVHYLIKAAFVGLLLTASPHALMAQTAPTASTAVTTSPAAKAAWGIDKSEISADADTLYGVLPNGMKYAIRRNNTPKGGASLRFRINVGSTAEEEDQQGLAHFLEHMAFNGSKRVPEGELIKILERLGLQFGPHTNAETGFGHTEYKLEMPKADNANLDTGLMLIREIASELTISQEAVDRERGVVLEDIRLRDNFGFRNFVKNLEFVLPGTPVVKRNFVGKAEVLKTAPAKRLRDFYEKYYEPKRSTLVVVGDFDPAMMEAQIKARFSDWKAKNPVVGNPLDGKTDPNRPIDAMVNVDKEAETNVSVSFLKPFAQKPDTVAGRQTGVADELIISMLNRRLSRLVQKPDTPILGGSFNWSDSYNTAEEFGVSISSKDRNWKAAIATAEQELRRAFEFGFSQAELTEQMANYRKSSELNVTQWKTRSSGGFADGIMSTSEGDYVFSHPKGGYDRQEALFARLKPEDLNARLRSYWGASQPLIYASHNEEIPGGRQALIDAWNASKAVKLSALTEAAVAKFAHTDFGPAGKIVMDKRIADMDVRTIKFANNVMLNLKKTDFTAGRIIVTVQTAGGAMPLLRQYPGADSLLVNLAQGGTTAHRRDELQSIFAGRPIAQSFSAGPNRYSSAAGSTQADLEAQLQLFAAYVTAPGFRRDFEPRYLQSIERIVRQMDVSLGGIAGRELPGLWSNNHPLMRFAGKDAMLARNFEELKPIVTKALQSGAIEIAVVGDLDEEKTIAAVAKTFGALPKRAAKMADPTAKEKVEFAKDRTTRTLVYNGKSELALAAAFWPAGDAHDVRRVMTLSLLSAVAQLKLNEVLREKLGATYSPNASYNPSSLFKGFGYFTLETTSQPASLDLVLAEMDKIALDLIKTPVTADAMLRARKPMVESMTQSKRDNGYWIGLIDEAQSAPKDLADARVQLSILESLTPADIQKAAATYLQPAQALRVKIIPNPNLNKK